MTLCSSRYEPSSDLFWSPPWPFKINHHSLACAMAEVYRLIPVVPPLVEPQRTTFRGNFWHLQHTQWARWTSFIPQTVLVWGMKPLYQGLQALEEHLLQSLRPDTGLEFSASAVNFSTIHPLFSFSFLLLLRPQQSFHPPPDHSDTKSPSQTDRRIHISNLVLCFLK